MSDLPSPKKHKTSNWSAIWVLPLVALAIGAWLAWRAFDQAGVDIQVRFESGDGIQANKTEVLYKGISVGKVTDLHVSKDIKGVVATIEIKKEAQEYLSKDTRFWLVKPRVSLAGVTGLETLVSGVYIAVDPVKGEKEERYFTALKEPPPLSDKLPGLHLTLKADRLGSLEQGSPVFYRQIQVGQVKSFQLGDDQRTIEIKVHIEPIDPGRTPVMFNGVQVGLVKSIDMGKDYSSATADLAMDPRVEDMLLEGTEFWTVKPSISLAGITGLEALVKGNYIDVRFAKSGAPSREFTIRPKAPPLNTDAPGLHLVLTSDKLGSIDIGAPILYRQVRVGSVQSYQLSRDRQRVVVGVHIEPEYAHLVNTSTRFWNSSGITLTGNLSGVQVKSESLQTLITGGISFDTLDPKAPTVTKVRRFTLFDSEEAAMARGVEIQLSIDNADGLREGTPIRFKGLDIGKIESVELNPDLSGVLMKARLTSAGERVARSGTRFWVVRPALGLLRTENLGTLVSGPYIEALPSSTPGERQARFQTLAEAPNLLGRENGLRLTLSAPRKGSIKPGNLVTYRQIPVGKVVDLALGEQADRVLISILIEPRYVPLVRTGSRFWNASGFGVDASLFKGLSLRTESMEALMEGGIAFATPNNAQMGEPAKPGQTFALFDSANDEWLEWAPKIPLKETARR
ncbi:PqiB family protein [Pseudomonas aeruginosa]|uniref:PqiB family protein n=1 Tax=Pseudomonas aeruginosa TaxID=287 RepID=UPI0010685F55|nr:MlaD family protein [Pseudomonas aeruginosa]TEC45456.1 MCE family protein [Pseudomonas aeruginosa]